MRRNDGSDASVGRMDGLAVQREVEWTDWQYKGGRMDGLAVQGVEWTDWQCKGR